MDSGKGFFLPVFRTSFHVCFQTLKRNTFLWMITLFGANTLRVIKDLSKSGSFFLLNAPKYLRVRLLYSLFVKSYFLKCIPLKKNPLNFKGFIVKISLDKFKLKCLDFKFPAWQNFKVCWWASFIKREIMDRNYYRNYGILGHQIALW